MAEVNGRSRVRPASLPMSIQAADGGGNLTEGPCSPPGPRSLMGQSLGVGGVGMGGGHQTPRTHGPHGLLVPSSWSAASPPNHGRGVVMRTFSTSSRGMFERLLDDEAWTAKDEEAPLDEEEEKEEQAAEGEPPSPSPQDSPSMANRVASLKTSTEDTPLLGGQDEAPPPMSMARKWANILLYGLINSVIMVPVMISYAAIM